MIVSIHTDDAHAEIEQIDNSIRIRYQPNNSPAAQVTVPASTVPNISQMVFHYANLLIDLAQGYRVPSQ
jgi:hypothetical protein